MIMTICLDNNKLKIIPTMYLNLVNNMPHKEEIINIYPSAFDEEEISSDFFLSIKESITSVNKFHRIIATLRFVFKLWKLSKKYNVEKIYLHHDVLWFNLLIRVILRKEIVMWLHDPDLHEGVRIKERIKRKINEYLFLRYISKFIVGWEKGIEAVKKSNYYTSGQKIEKVFLPEVLEAEFDDLRSKENDIRYDYIFFGSLTKYKGLDELIKAFMSDELSNYSLLIIGTGPLRKFVEKIAKERKNIFFVNELLPWRELASYICMSRFVILPYHNATGTQTVQIANYYKKMVICTRVGSFAEYIVEGENGYFLNNCTENEIIKLVARNEKQEVNINGLVNEFKKFKIDIIAKELYDSIID